MRKRSTWLGVTALLATTWLAIPAEAAVVPPRVDSYSIQARPPVAVEPRSAGDKCDYNWINCGWVEVNAQLSRLQSLKNSGATQAFLGGSARVKRVYGCQTAAGRRLARYDRSVKAKVNLNTRRGVPILIAQLGETRQVSVYNFLPDAQPGNCPKRAKPMLYVFKVSKVTLTLNTAGGTPPVRAKDRLPGTARWSGAVPTVTPAAD